MATMNNAPSTQTPARQGNSIRFGSGWAKALLSIRRRLIDRIAPKSVVATKNYAGRHDQQMHTTLFNLANPSQGRRGSGRDKKDEERSAYAGGPAAVASGVAVSGTEAQPSVNVGLLLDRAPLLKQEAFDNYYNGGDGIWSVIPLTMGNTTELSQAVAVDEIRNRALGSTYNVDFKYGDPSPAGRDYLDTQAWLEYKNVGMFLGERATAQQERGNDILKKELGRIAGMVKGDVNADSLSRSSQVIFKELVRANKEKEDVNAYREFAFAKTITVRNLQDQKNYLDDVISKIERGISVPQTYLTKSGRREETFPPVAAENPRNTPEYRQLITDLAAAKATQFPAMVSHTSNFWDAQAKAVLDLTPQQQRGREIFEKNGREADTLLRTHLEKLIDAAPLRINMTLENLPKALDSDSYKSAFEVTGTTAAGGRGLQKDSEQGGTTSSGSNRAFRMAAEKKFYGITESSSPTESPIYSYVGLQHVDRQAGKGPRDPYTGERYQGKQNTENISHLYGTVTLNLRPTVRGRATITPDDSIALLGQSSAAVPLRGSGTGVPPQFLAGGGRLVEAAYESAKAGSKTIAVPTQYVESQIFGGVKLSRDVESVSIFVPTFSGDRIRRDLSLGSGNRPHATQSLMDGISRAKSVFNTTAFTQALTSFVSKGVPVEIIASQTGERVLVKSLADIRRALKDIPEEAQGGWTEAFKSFSIYKAANTPRVVVNRFGGGWTKTLLAIKSGSPVNEVSRTAVSTKNYGGRHDQQMHATLEKYTRKSLKNLTKQHGLLSTKLLRVALKTRGGKETDTVASPKQNAPNQNPVAPFTQRDQVNLQQYETLENSAFSGLLQNSMALDEIAAQTDASLTKAILAYGEQCPPILYRAIKGIRASQLGLHTGMKFENAAWQSTTRSKQQALLMGKGGTIFTLLIAPKLRVNVLDMTRFSSDKGKREVVLPKNATLQVDRIKEGKGEKPDVVIMQVSFPESQVEQELVSENQSATEGAGMTLSSKEAARFYNDFMRSSGIEYKPLDQGDLPVMAGKDLREWKQELDKAYDTYGADVGKPSVTQKNYVGRHDQQMHTTLFNLANPSQGRREGIGDKKGGETRARELAVAATPIRAVDPAVARATERTITELVDELGTSGQLRGTEQEIKQKVTALLTEVENALPPATQIGPNSFVTTINANTFIAAARDGAGSMLEGTPDKMAAGLLQAMVTKLDKEIDDWRANPDKPMVNVSESRGMARNATDELKERIGTNAWKNSEMQTRILRDADGKLCGVSLVDTQSYGRYQYVEYIGTNPMATNRAGETLMVHIAQSAVRAGGGIKLFSLRGAVRFYKKLGFKSADPRATEPFLKRWGGGMELSREGAMALSQRQSSKELIKLKNYSGRHDQQMHTTLFNLANPSQGRRGSGRDKKDGETRAYAGGPATTTTAGSSTVAPAGETTVDISTLKPETGWLNRKSEIEYESGLADLVKWGLEDKAVEINAFWDRNGFSPNNVMGFGTQRTRQQDLDDAENNQWAVAAYFSKVKEDDGRRAIETQWTKAQTSDIFTTRDSSTTLWGTTTNKPSPLPSQTLNEMQKANPVSQMVFRPNDVVKMRTADIKDDKGRDVYGYSSRPVTREMVEKGERLYYQTAREIEGRVFARAHKLIDTAPVAIAMTPADFKDMIRTGSYKNMHQRMEESSARFAIFEKAAKGLNSEARALAFQKWKAEQIILHPESGRVVSNSGSPFKNIRDAVDMANYGITSSSGKDHPISGYMQTSGAANVAAQYGNISIVLKSAVRARTAVGFGDSLGHLPGQSFLASPSGGVTRASIGGNIYALSRSSDKEKGTKITDESGKVNRRSNNNTGYDGFIRKYVEAQIHGGVTPRDIASIVIKDKPGNLSNQPVVDWAKANGIKIEYAPLSGSMLENLVSYKEIRIMSAIATKNYGGRTVLGQNDSHLLITNNNQDLSSMESTGFILDLDNKITYDTTLYSAFNMGIWYDPKPNTKIPAWFDGKPTSFTSVSEGDKEDSASKYMQSLIVPKTDANNGRFGADLILGLLAAKKRRLNP